MQRILSASLGAALFSYSAMATAVAAPNTPNPPSWTGFYVGGNIGYSWGEARTDIAGDAIFASTSGVILGGLPWRTPFALSDRARLEGVIGGGQIGYNFQFNRYWLFGIEADLQASRERGTSSPTATLSDNVPTGFTIDGGTGQFILVFSPLAGTALTNWAKIDWFGTLRARVRVPCKRCARDLWEQVNFPRLGFFRFRLGALGIRKEPVPVHYVSFILLR